MLPFRRAGPSVVRALGIAAPNTQKLLASTAVPLNEPLFDVPPKGTPREPQSVQVTTLNNGMKVASVETQAPTSRVGLFFDAGSRYESQENLGVSHFLRSAAFSSTKDRTAFKIARELEQCGANLEATSTRDHLIFAADCKRDNVQQVVDSLGSVTTSPIYSPWELEDTVDRVKLDLAIAATQPQIAVLEDLHRAAYRKNLGNSIYCLPHRVGHITTNTLIDYSQQFFAGKGVALVGVGVDHQEFVQQAENAFSSLPQGDAPTKEAAKYFGGEIVNHKPFPMVHAALVTEGASLNSKDVLAFGILQRLLGTTPFIKWGSNTATSRLNKAASEVADGPFFASSLNMSYSDSGLFGIYVISTPGDIGKVMKAALGQCLKASKGEISDAEIARAKNQMRANVLMGCESQQTLSEDMGAQVLIKGAYTPSSEVVTAIDSVSKSDILSIAKRVFTTKPTISAAGDVTNVPHINDLF